MGDTIDSQHERRLERLLAHQEKVVPVLKSKLAAAAARGVSDGHTHTARSRLAVVENEVHDYLFSVMDVIRQAGRAQSDARRGELYAEYVSCAGDCRAAARLRRQQEAEREEQMMHVGRGRKRRGVRRRPQDQTPSHDCRDCKGEACRYVNSKEACMICTKCGVCETFLDLSQATMPFGMASTVPSSEYKRLNHFTELLAQAQGKEKAEVPQEVVDRVRQEIAAHGITDPDMITRARVRHFLKQIKCIKVPVAEDVKVPRIPGRVRHRKRPRLEEKRESHPPLKPQMKGVNGSRYGLSSLPLPSLLLSDFLSCHFKVLQAHRADSSKTGRASGGQDTGPDPSASLWPRE